MSIRNAQLAGFLSRGNGGSFFCTTKVPLVCALTNHIFFHHSQLSDHCSDKIAFLYRGTVHLVDIITRQFFEDESSHT